MKRKLLYSTNAKRWNLLLRKFNNLYKRFQTGDLTEQHLQRLSNKLQSIYKRLEKMQYAVGVKLAGTAIALTMLSATSLAQDFSSIGRLTANNNKYFCNDLNQVFADIDGDSDLDLYVGDGYYGEIKVFINDGSGNFTAAGNLQADGSDIIVDEAAPEFADVDGDNDLDLYVGAKFGKIKVFVNDGSGNFSADGNLQADGIDIDLDVFDNIIPAFADIDGDSDLDLYLGEQSSMFNSGSISVFINDGDGNFSASGYMQADGMDINIGYYRRAAPVFADIDSDSDLDLYVGNNSQGKISVFINNGSGNFSAAGNLQADGIDIDIGSTPEFADIDNDNDLDLYVSRYDGIKVFTNDGSGNFSAAGNLHNDGGIIDIGDYDATPVFADIDGDSDLDLYVGELDGTINVFTNDGSGNFTAIGNLQADGSDVDGGYKASPTFADIDGDSDLDLYIGEYYESIKVFTNNGSGIFTAAGNLQADGLDILVELASPVFADIDGDNDLDLYVGEYFGHVEVFFNDGSGNFSADGNLQADGSDIDVVYYATPAFADIDSDSDLDLYIGEEDGNVEVFLNDGYGNFSAVGNMQADGSDVNVDYRTTPAFADIDSDGDLDLYLGEKYGKISVFINNESHEGFDLEVKTLLQGPFIGSEMNTSLNEADVLPLSQPYDEAPWNYNGNEEVTSIPNENVVDWVLVELRESVGDVATAIESTVIEQKAAFILQNGSIVGLDGSSNLSFDITVTQNLYVVIKHRNHLGIISSIPLVLSDDTYSYDFSDAANNAYGGELSQIEVVPGVWSMIAGNGDGNDQIDNKDKNEVWLLENNTTGYFSGDYDMDSHINSTDNSIIWKPNSGSGGQIP